MGNDRIPLSLLKALPKQVWGMVAAVFRGIERGLPWPKELCDVLLCAIPRSDASGSGAVGPSKYRMISVTCHVYRIWAGIWAKRVGEEWLRKIAPRHLHGGVRGRNALSAAQSSSACWDLAMTRSVPLWGLVLDATKCFDSLSVKGIGLAARQLGLPGELIGALKRWYDVHQRHVIVHSWAQPPFSPTRGILQGCPLSVCFCSIWGMLWAHKAAQHLAAVPPQIGHLTVFLDDLSMLSSHKPALETAMGYTQLFLDFWKVELNAAKSRLLANEAAQRHDLPNAIVGELDNRQGLLGAPAGMEVANEMLQKGFPKLRFGWIG